MYLNMESRRKDFGPVAATQILNTAECNVTAVGITLWGNLWFRNRGALGGSQEIDKVIFLSSKAMRNRIQRHSVAADFDIYTKDGRVIEVHSEETRIIEAALKYSPVNDPRARYRKERGV